jgi:hypothetical protein
MIGIEHAQTLGHIAQGRVEARILSLELFLALPEQLVLLRQARVEPFSVADDAAGRTGLLHSREPPSHVAKSRRCMASPGAHRFRSQI